ncbi:MAG: tRNA epoxyqueuosine(34) reductase QueG [Cyanobacteria bacterium P01_H01_bin.121]
MPSLDAETVKQHAIALGFDLVGIAAIASNQALAQQQQRLRSWLDQGFQADMAWMQNPRRVEPRQILPTARSMICVAVNYYTPVKHSQDPCHGKISRYGWGRDYHRILQKRLKALTQWLTAQDPCIQARFYADTGPVADKFWAEQAGLGWVAKNGNLITRQYGSWVLLGEVLTNLELAADRPHTEHCGTCQRCLLACPTAAIVQPFVVDANRCIAYHTIENRAPELPPQIRKNLQGWVAGCDVCQDVCPWNQRFAQTTQIQDFQPYPWNVQPELIELANLSEAEWQRRFPASALRRIKAWMWRRNARANLTNLADQTAAQSEPVLPQTLHQTLKHQRAVEGSEPTQD